MRVVRVQVEILGNSLFDFIHPCDHDDLRGLVNHKSQGDNEQSGILVRMNCTLNNKGRSVNSKSLEYKVFFIFLFVTIIVFSLMR